MKPEDRDIASRKDTEISRQDAAPTDVKKMWGWLPATIVGGDLLVRAHLKTPSALRERVGVRV